MILPASGYQSVHADRVGRVGWVPVATKIACTLVYWPLGAPLFIGQYADT